MLHELEQLGIYLDQLKFKIDLDKYLGNNFSSFYFCNNGTSKGTKQVQNYTSWDRKDI